MTPRIRGLTLLEILIVVGIIATLVAILVPVLRGPLAKRQLVEAHAMLDSMAIALDKLKQDYHYDGVFGKSDTGEKIFDYHDTNQFAKELAPNHTAWNTTYTPRLNTQKTHYVDYRQHSIKNACVIDPWGNPYRYSVFVRESQHWPYEVEALYSDGPDRMIRTADDIIRELREYPSPPANGDASKPKFTVADLENIWSGVETTNSYAK
jgi:type II secretory pathway pseudopilin PulG